MKNTFHTIETTHKDNFKDVIPVYNYSNSKENATYSADMEDVIKRSTLAIQVHEVSNWADDCMLLIGKANFVKGEYNKAENTFQYITSYYKNGVDYYKISKENGKVVKKKKPKKQPKKKKPEFAMVAHPDGTKTLDRVSIRPSYNLMEHSPVRSEALVWLVKTFTQLKKYDEAAAIYAYAKNDNKFYTNLDKDLELANADLQVSRRLWGTALESLDKYLGMTKKHKERLRPLFIMAQINEEQHNYKKATEYYKQVLKSGPNYDMEFYAKIKMARLGRKSGSPNSEIKGLLVRMSHDGKYKEYYDQIFYELAEISLSENDKEMGKKYLHKSVRASTKNKEQLALSFLKLAELDYQDEKYVTSKYFYDSTLTAMDKSAPDYYKIEDRDKVLSKLVKQLEIIHNEDSLQRIAKMSKGERDALFKKQLAQKEKEEEAKEEAKNSSKSSFDPTKPKDDQNTNAEGTFYFYNTAAKSQGYNDFIKRWGKRKLEDNWRRKDKAVTSVLAEGNDSTKSSSKDSLGTDGKKKDKVDKKPKTAEEKLADNLPMGEEKLQASNAKLIDAYYAMGTIYKDDLVNYPKATSAFEEMNKRFGKHKLQLESYYNLYLIADKTKNSTKATYYKNLILAEYPESVIAKLLENPNYLAETKKKDNILEEYYASTFNDFNSGQYESAAQKCLMADVKFNPNPLKPKFDLLNALVLAKQNRLDDYVQSLNKIISKTNDVEVKTKAQEFLSNLNHSKLPMMDLSKDTAHKVIDSLNSTLHVDATPIKKDSIVSTAKNTIVKEEAKKDDSKSPKSIEPTKASTTPKDSSAAKTTAKENSTKPISKDSTNVKNTTVKKDSSTAKTTTTAKGNEKKTATIDSTKSIAKENVTKHIVKDSTNVKNTTAKKDSTNKTKATANAKDTKQTVKADTVKTPVTPKPAPVVEDDTDDPNTPYGLSDAAPHSCIIIFKDPAAQTTALSAKLEAFNTANFAASHLANRMVLIDKDNKLMNIKPFANKAAAMVYYNQLIQQTDVFTGLTPEQYSVAVITTLNFGILLNEKKSGGYLKFFRKNYK